MNNLLFPLQLKRQYAGPLDSDSLFISVEAMEMFKTSPLIYDGMIATCSAKKGEVFVYNKTDNIWMSQKIDINSLDKINAINKDGDGTKFLNNKGLYEAIKQINVDWLNANPSSPEYIKNKPDFYTKDEIVAAFEILVSAIESNYSTKSEMTSIATHQHLNFNLLNLLKMGNNGELMFDGKALLTGIKLTSKSVITNFDSSELAVSLNVPDLLLNHIIETHMDSELIISGDDVSVEIWDGPIKVDSFINTGVQMYNTGFSKDLIVKTNGVGILKFNYIYIERS